MTEPLFSLMVFIIKQSVITIAHVWFSVPSIVCSGWALLWWMGGEINPLYIAVM